MASHVRIRFLLGAAVTVIAIAILGAAQLQRVELRGQFEENQSITDLRLAALSLDAAVGSGNASDSSYELAQGQIHEALQAARDHTHGAREAALLTRQGKALTAYTTAARSGTENHERLAEFLTLNREHLDELEDEREARQRTAAAVPAGLVLLLSLVFALLHVWFIERPARGVRRRARNQDEFGAAMQVARSEPEAYEMLARHVRRSAATNRVTVLNRNNSADRLEAATAPEPGSVVADGLQNAKPDSCLAMRLGRPHQAANGDESLLSCDVCGKTAERITCVPSLVGGEVIGAVLVEHEAPLDGDALDQVTGSVAEAAPVIANLRNLAIAELRAATDGLTGLPNQRSVHETLKRMAAQAGRTLDPLTLVLFDLDHFKSVNDTHGHGKGDEVLAAVGAAAATAVRTSDFVGRLGGEEFAVLLPATDRDGGVELAEKLRHALSEIRVPGVDRTITASFGVASLPTEAGDPGTLMRCADRALYTAKGDGRDRVRTLVTP